MKIPEINLKLETIVVQMEIQKINIMTLQEQIGKDMVNAMKSRDKKILSLLRVVTGEFGRAMKSSKQLNDDEALKIIRKMSDNAKDLGNNGEVLILEKYLPKMFDETAIHLVVTEIIQTNNYSGMRDMGKVMGKIKTSVNSSRIDGTIASKITKELLMK